MKMAGLHGAGALIYHRLAASELGWGKATTELFQTISYLGNWRIWGLAPWFEDNIATTSRLKQNNLQITNWQLRKEKCKKLSYIKLSNIKNNDFGLCYRLPFTCFSQETAVMLVHRLEDCLVESAEPGLFIFARLVLILSRLICRISVSSWR